MIMKKAPFRGTTLLEILVALGIFGIVGAVLVFSIRSGSKEIQFTSDHLNAVILTQKVAEDLIEEIGMNPYGIETLGLAANSRDFQEITDGGSVFFSQVEDRVEPWGFIDPARDGVIDQGMQPLYKDIRKFKLALSGQRLSASGEGPERNLVSCKIDLAWDTKTGRGELNSQSLFFSPATPRKTDLAYVVNEPEVDARIPGAVFRKPGKTIPEISATIGENVETVQAFGRISLITGDFVASAYFNGAKALIAKQKEELARTPETDLEKQYRLRLAIARQWYDLSKTCFQVVAYLVPHFALLKAEGKFNQAAGTGFNGISLQHGLYLYRIIYEHFVGSIVQARFFYYALLQDDLSRFKGGKCQLQVLQKLMDIYRVVAILPTRPEGMQEYRNFLARIRKLADGRNPFLGRLVDQEIQLLENPVSWMDRLPNLKRISEIVQGKIPGILGFIGKTTSDSVGGKTPNSQGSR